jgi:hypothetical protein
MTNAEIMRRLINELEAEIAGTTTTNTQQLLPDGRKVLSENKKDETR